MIRTFSRRYWYNPSNAHFNLYNPSNAHFSLQRVKVGEQASQLSPHRSAISASLPEATATRSERLLRRSTPSRLWICSTVAIFFLPGAATIGFMLAPLPPPEATPRLRNAKDPASDPLDALLPEALADTLSHLARHSNASLIKSWATYLLSENQLLVDYGPDLLERLSYVCHAVPGVGGVVQAAVNFLIRQTFFAQYTGGETPDDCLSVLNELLSQGIAGLVAYAVEGSVLSHTTGKTSAGCSVSLQHVYATHEAIDYGSKLAFSPTVATAFKPTSVALKLSGLVTDPYVFERASNQLVAAQQTPWNDISGPLFPPGEALATPDRQALDNLMRHLSDICAHAKHQGIRVIVDAEYTWFQPAIDRICQTLCSQFNDANSPPVVYHTFQAYLLSTPGRLLACLDAASDFSLGIKLVRGAYLASETAHHKAACLPGPPPTWSSKPETDQCYNKAASMLVSRLAGVIKAGSSGGAELGLVIAGHNATSVRNVLEQLRTEGLAENRGACLALSEELRGRLMFGQLFGMADNLTGVLLRILIPGRSQDYCATSDLPFVMKYVPFGKVSEVLPYLGRRAQENKSILNGDLGRGGAKAERLAVEREIRRRLRWLVGIQH